MMEDKTFDLEDLDEEFWKKVVFIHWFHSTGLGGPGAIWFVTEDQREYYLGFEDLPFNEHDLAENLHPMFKATGEFIPGRYGGSKYAIEDEGWHYLQLKDVKISGETLIRDDIYDAFMEAAKNKDREVSIGYLFNVMHFAALAIGADTLERINYIRSVEADRRRKETWEEHERNKFLPEHLVWKPMHMNNMEDNPIEGEYALIVNRDGEKLTAKKFTILFQKYMSKPMMIDPSRGVECYVLFEKYYYDFYGPIEYPPTENKWLNREENFQSARHEMAFFDWICLSDGDIHDYGSFVRCFQTIEEAKEYALCFANANSHRAWNRHTMVTELDPIEDHKLRVERYEAYQAYRKHYKKIMETIVNFDGYPSTSSGGGAYLIEAILEAVPEITKKQLMYFWHDLPKVLEKRTYDVIEEERQRSMDFIRKNEEREDP